MRTHAPSVHTHIEFVQATPTATTDKRISVSTRVSRAAIEIRVRNQYGAINYLLHQSLINHLNLLSDYREHFDIDSIKFIEASPCTGTEGRGRARVRSEGASGFLAINEETQGNHGSVAQSTGAAVTIPSSIPATARHVGSSRFDSRPHSTLQCPSD